MDGYTYEYDPDKTLEENVAESLKMDALRSTLSLQQNSDKLIARAEAGRAASNGFKHLKPLDNQMEFC